MLPLHEPTLEGEGVRLRPYEPGDGTLVRAAGHDEYITAITTVPSAATDPSDADIDAYLERQHARLSSGQGVQLVIEDEASGRAVGQVGLMAKDAHRAAVGYWVIPAERGHGYAGRALRVLSEWALALPGLHRLEASVETWNYGSMSTVEGARFVREGVVANWEMINGTPRDMVLYARVPDGHRGWEAQVRQFQSGVPLTEWHEADREGCQSLLLWAYGGNSDALVRLAEGHELSDAERLHVAWIASLALHIGYVPPAAVTPTGAVMHDAAREIILNGRRTAGAQPRD